MVLFITCTWAQNGFHKDEVLSHYGILRLQDKEKSRVFTSRLRAKGEPVFLIRDFRKGIQQNDIIRFKDKAVLIDANIWQTMKKDKILQHLAKIPVIHLKAKSNSNIWNNRGKTVSNSQEKKGYFLGGEFLKILESYFSDTPKDLEMVIRFEGSQMVLLAPKELMKAIQFTKVIARKPHGKPQIISPKPIEKQFANIPFSWKVWAVNPSNPQSELRYSLNGDLPDGLQWNAATHTIEGTPTTNGTWKATALVSNASKKTDSLSFSITTRENQPPIIANTPSGEVMNDQPWKFTPILSDPDHATEDLLVEAHDMPDGMMFDKKRRAFRWDLNAYDSTRRERISFGIVVTDPLGQSVTRSFKLRVLSPKLALKAKGVNLNLPLDTLLQGRSYTWPDSSWLGSKIQMQAIQGSHFTNYTVDSLSGEGYLEIIPSQPGICTLTTTFILDGAQFNTTKYLTVIKNYPPIFKSSLSTRTFTEEQLVTYTPTVVDLENDSITAIDVVDHKGRPVQWNGKSVTLNTSKTGKYVYEFSARDASNQMGYQRISYEVIPKDRKWVGVDIETKLLTNRTPLHIVYRNGSSRFGLFVPDIYKVDPAKLYLKSAPFVTAEANLLGEQSAATGTYLNVGAGITIRYLKPGLITGGLLLTNSGKYTNQDGEPWIFQYSVQFFAKHAYVLTDTTGYGQMDSSRAVIEEAATCYDDFKKAMDEDLNEGDEINARNNLVGCVNDVMAANDTIDAQNIMPENMEMALEEFDDDTNMNLLIQIETWYPFKYGFWAGPVFWKDAIIFKGEDSETRAGLGIRHEYSFDVGPFDISYEAAVRAGWAGDGSDVKILGDLMVHFGR